MALISKRVKSVGRERTNRVVAVQLAEAAVADQARYLSCQVVVVDDGRSRVLVAHATLLLDDAAHERRQRVGRRRRVERVDVPDGVDRQDVLRVALVQENVRVPEPEREVAEADVLHRCALDEARLVLVGVIFVGVVMVGFVVISRESCSFFFRFPRGFDSLDNKPEAYACISQTGC